MSTLTLSLTFHPCPLSELAQQEDGGSVQLGTGVPALGRAGRGGGDRTGWFWVEAEMCHETYLGAIT